MHPSSAGAGRDSSGQRGALPKGGLPDLRRFRRIQKQHGATHLDELTAVQLGKADVGDLHHISRMKARDGSCIFRVRICKTCSKLQHLIELGSYKRLEPAILVHDAHELLHRRAHKLRVLTPDDRAFLHLLKVSNHGRAVNIERIPVIDILLDRVKKYYMARFFSNSATTLLLNQANGEGCFSDPQSQLDLNDGIYQSEHDVVDSLREMGEIASKSSSSSSNSPVAVTIPNFSSTNLLNLAETFTYHGSFLSTLYLSFGLTESLVDSQLDTAQVVGLLLHRKVEKLQSFEPTSALPPILWKLAASCYVPVATSQLQPIIEQLDLLQDQPDEAITLAGLIDHAQALTSVDEEPTIAHHTQALQRRLQELITSTFTTQFDMREPSWMLADLPDKPEQDGYVARLSEMFRNTTQRIEQVMVAMQLLNQNHMFHEQTGKVERDSEEKIAESTASSQPQSRHQLFLLRQRLANISAWDILQIQQMALQLELADHSADTYSDIALQMVRQYDEAGGNDQVLGGVKFCRATSTVAFCAQRSKNLRMASRPYLSMQDLRHKVLVTQLVMLEACAEMLQLGLTVGITFRTADDVPSGSAFLVSHESTLWAYVGLLVAYQAVDATDQEGIANVCKNIAHELHVPAKATFDALTVPPVQVVLNVLHAFLHSMQDWMDQTNCMPYLMCTYSSVFLVGSTAETLLAQGKLHDRREQLQELLDCAQHILSRCGERFKASDFFWRLLRDRPSFSYRMTSNLSLPTHKRPRVNFPDPATYMAMRAEQSKTGVYHPSRFCPVVTMPEFNLGHTHPAQTTRSRETTPSSEEMLPPAMSSQYTTPHPGYFQTYAPVIASTDTTVQALPSLLFAERANLIHDPTIDYGYTSEEISALKSIFDA